MTFRTRVLAAIVPLLMAAESSAQDGARAEWRQWRGPGNSGSSPGATPPLTWSADEHIRWKSPVPGEGAATPIVFGDLVVVLSAFKTDEEREPVPVKPLMQRGRGEDAPRPPPPSHVYDFLVQCYDRADGTLRWSTTVASELPHEGHHRHGSYAAGSAMTDGERIYAFFNSFGLYGLSLEGELLWGCDFGDMTFDRGEGASAAIHDGTIVVPWDHRGDSEVIAVDAATGEETWRRARKEGGSRSTPTIVQVDGTAQAILYGRVAQAYDLETGDIVWRCRTGVSGAVASPITSDGMAYLFATGQRGGFFGAMDLSTAKGDCEAFDWEIKRDIPHVPSPACHRGVLYTLKKNDAMLSAFDAKTGERLYGPERLGLGTVYSSIVAAGERVYVTDREGSTVVVRHGPEYAELARCELDEAVVSSMALAGDAIFIRGERHLYCIGQD